jgi:hypothetical protein
VTISLASTDTAATAFASMGELERPSPLLLGIIITIGGANSPFPLAAYNKGLLTTWMLSV